MVCHPTPRSRALPRLLHFALLGWLAASANLGLAAEEKKATPPALPKEFAFVLSNGYGEIDKMPADPAVFENLLINMKKAGFNTIHCIYRDWRIPLCRKHGVKMMVDVLAWKEGAEMDIRRPAQRAKVEEICKKLHGEEAVWGYNLWNEKLAFFGYPDDKSIDDYIDMLKRWDPTHPVWMGTYRVSAANGPKMKPGVHAYYDYHWQRGFIWHFADLQWYLGHVAAEGGTIGRWLHGSNYNWNSYTLNTSIPFGLKTAIWFIGGPFDEKGEIDPEHRFYHLVKIGQEMHQLYAEIGAMGRPSGVFSTATRKTHENKDKVLDIPFRLPAFPEDFWFKVTAGEVLAGFFKGADGRHRVYVANHNAFARQDVAFTVDAKELGTAGGVVEMFDRATGKWSEIKPHAGNYRFPLRTAGGELLRIGVGVP